MNTTWIQFLLSASSRKALTLTAIGVAAGTAVVPTQAARQSGAAAADVRDARFVEADRTAASATAPATELGAGALMFEGTSARVPAPLLATDVAIDVSGPIARTKLTQHFENPSDGWVEGVYLFPLPEGAAVDTLKVRVGDKFIEGQIQERAQARRTYEAAKAEGKKAGLIEQERPNVFRSSVANIGPRETIVVQIEYQEMPRYADGHYSLRFPMVVAPRYNPESSATVLAPPSGAAPTPVLEAASSGAPHNPLKLHVNLHAGFDIAEIKSSYHRVKVTKRTPRESEIDLAGAVPADRDFELRWEARKGMEPTASLFRERIGGDDYLLALIMPPAAPVAPRPREAIFVIDNSGSMGGESMRQAKAGLDLALAGLRTSDTFNVIRFDDSMTELFPAPVAATSEHVAKARKYVASLEASGGTEMLPALKAALRHTGGPLQEGRVREVIFLTDGAVGNEDEMFAEIGTSLGATRLFPVGIGSAPNSFFMARAARLGRGSFTFIGDTKEVTARVATLLRKIDSPVMTDLVAELPGAEVWPSPVPDVFAGEPVVVTAKMSAPHAKLNLRGELGGRAWNSVLDPDAATSGTGIGKMWARGKIESLDDQVYTGVSKDKVDAEVLKVALGFHLVSRLTSLVAVENVVARPAGTPVHTQQVALNMPAGWDFNKVFGELPSRGAGAGYKPVGLQVRERAPKAKGLATAAEEVDLPQTATSMGMLALQGFALCLLAGVFYLARLHTRRAEQMQ